MVYQIEEKNLFKDVGISTNQFVAINSNDDLDKALEILGLPFIIKARTDGYDGKFQFIGIDQNEVSSFISIYNILGETLMKFNANITNQEIDISNQPNGVYVVHIESKENISKLKIIKN